MEMRAIECGNEHKSLILFYHFRIHIRFHNCANDLALACVLHRVVRAID